MNFFRRKSKRRDVLSAIIPLRPQASVKDPDLDELQSELGAPGRTAGLAEGSRLTVEEALYNDDHLKEERERVQQKKAA